MPRESASGGGAAIEGMDGGAGAAGAVRAAPGPTGTVTTGAGVEAGRSFSQGDTDAHAASIPTIGAIHGIDDMWLILLEALGALAILVLIVWWTMFSGRKKGERKDDP
jgi:hypothetical protein